MKEYKYKIDGKEYKVVINDVEDSIAEVEVNGIEYKVDIMGKKVKPAPTIVRSMVTPAAPAASSGSSVKSPLPGIVLDIMVKVGDTVKTGQKVVLLEAMKMENVISSDSDGKVTAIKVNKGDSVLEGAELIVFE